ncbi:hypothetical protein CO652_23090 [Rhizobium sp. H4]|nr:hypothetical protein CO652_23090 [Rhizobium sp. H4]
MAIPLSAPAFCARAEHQRRHISPADCGIVGRARGCKPHLRSATVFSERGKRAPETKFDFDDAFPSSNAISTSVMPRDSHGMQTFSSGESIVFISLLAS